MHLRLLALAGVVVAAFAAGACGSASGENSGVSQEIAIEGSSTVQPITQAAVELFKQENSEARISVGGAGTSDGFEAFCQGKTEISDASRPIEAEETQLCKKNKVEYIEIPVAYDGISVVVNKQNDWATNVTSEELKTLWEPAAQGKVNQWSQVRPEWPSRPIELYGPGTESGTFDFFTEEINGEEDASRSDYQASEDDNVLVQGVSGDENALGYFGYSYYESNRDALKVLALGGVKPTTQTIRSGEYGLSRPLFIYVSKDALKKNSAVKPFVDFYLSEQNLNRLVEAARYVTLPDSLVKESRAQYEDRTTGTVMTPEGDPKGGDLEAALEQSR